MLFNIISEFNINNPLNYDKGLVTLYHNFDKAIEAFPDVVFLNNKITKNIYWTDDLEDFFYTYFEENLFEVENVFTPIKDPEFIIDSNKEFFFLKNNKIYTLNKEYIRYFNLNFDIKTDFIKIEKILRNYYFNFSLKELEEYCNEIKIEYCEVLFYILTQFEIKENLYVSSIINCREFLSNNKVYNFIEDSNRKLDETKNLFAKFNFTDSISGRLYCKELQTLSKEQKKDFTISQKNCYLIEFDFSAFEYNILCDILGIEKSKDPHIKILEYLNIHINNREIGKRINYAYLYGMNLKKVCTEIFLETGMQINEELLLSFPIFNEKPNFKIENNYLLNYFGKKIKIEKIHAILNYYIQSTAADIFFYKLNNIIEFFPQNLCDRIISQSHDSLLIQLSNKTIENTNLLEKIKQELEKPLDIFTFDVKMNYAQSFYEISINK